MDDMITWTREKLERFKRALAKCPDGKAPADEFDFDGRRYVRGFAEYLVQYLEQRLA